MSQVFVFDPTASDSLSQVRGIGRYLKLLKENFSNEFTFTNKLITHHSSIRQAQDPEFIEGSPITFINPFFDPLKTPLVMKRIAKKQICVIHDLIPLKYPTHFPVGIRGKLNIFLNKLALRNYNLIITDSEASKKDIINLLKVKSEKIKVIYPTISKIFFEKRTTSNLASSIQHLASKNYFLYVGDATWNKNLVNLAEAIKLANVNCVFVGKVFNVGNADLRSLPTLNHPWQKDLKQFLEITKDDKRFIFPGFISDEELISLYQNATANILVSHDEGFGFSYFEAASQNTPSVLSDEPIFKETASDTALFAKTNDPQDIAEKIKKLFADKNLRNELGQKAHERLNQFNQEKFKTNMLEVI